MVRAAADGTASAEIATELSSEASALIKRGADHVLLAQTELSPFATQITDDVPFTDSLDCLCDAIESSRCLSRGHALGQ